MQLTLDDQMKLDNLYNALRVEKDVVLYASQGQEGQRTTYVGKLSMADVITQFPQVPQDMDLPSHVMIQRDLDGTRAKGIASYIGDNAKDFIFPALMAIVETLKVESVVENIVKLTIPASAFRYLVDGQGRRGGAQMLLKDTPAGLDLSKQSFDIKIIESMGVNADNQVCVDVNTTPKSFNQSQKAAMDSRKVISLFSKEVVMGTPVLRAIVDFKRASVTQSSTSPYIWTLNQMAHFIKKLTGTSDNSCQVLLSEDAKRAYIAGFVSKWFEQIAQNQQLGDALGGKISATDVRASTIIGSAVFLKSLALVAKVVKLHMESKGAGQADWSILSGIRDVDFSHENPEWVGRCKNLRGGYEDKTWNHQATAAYVLGALGLAMPAELIEVENQVKTHRQQPILAEVVNG